MGRTADSVGRRAALQGVSILAALALAAAWMPAAAAQGPGGTEACWEEIGRVPFTDTAGLGAESLFAIDCLVHYGITRGTTATTYSPEARVTRLQAAHFLVRTLVALELELPDDSSAHFDDLVSVGAADRETVAQLKEMGIARGATASRFAPGDSVQRAQMAQFLLRILKLTETTLPDPAEDAFDDLEDASAAAREAVGVVAALGIMEARAPRRFEPRAAMTREHMALVLARTLEAARARPVRLELSLSSESVPVGGAAEATVRLTKPDGEPYPDLLVDVFAAYGTTAGGDCILDTGAHVSGGDAGTSHNCRMDSGDPRTDHAGEVRVGLSHSPRQAVHWVYAWAGAEGQDFGGDEVRTQARARIGWHPQPTEVTTTVPQSAEFWRAATVTARLIGLNAGGKRMVLLAGATSGAAPRAMLVETTIGAGRVAFDLPGLADPAESHERSLPVTETVLVFWDRNANSVHDGPAEPSARTVITWRRG